MKKENKTQTTHSNIVGVYHSQDLDGWASGSVMHYVYPEIKLVGYDYGQAIPECIWLANEIIVADVSFTIDVYKKLLERGCKLTLIDHHQSSIREVIDSGLLFRYNNLTVKFDVYLSACELCWKQLTDLKSMPWVLEYIGINDMKLRQDLNLSRYLDTIKPTCIAYSNAFYSLVTTERRRTRYETEKHLTTKGLSVEGFEAYWFGIGGVNRDYDKNLGKKIMAHRQIEYDFVATNNSFTRLICGYRAICINTSFRDIDLFSSVYDPNIHDVMVLFHFNGEKYRFSVYSHKSEIDASLIAKNFDGGGHCYAAGFEIDSIDDIFEKPRYYQLDEVFDMIDEPNRSKTKKYFEIHRVKIEKSLGSGHNHQSWTGGYKDHLTEICNIAIVYYNALSRCRKLSFSLSDVLVGLLWHDAEKPFKYAGTDEEKALLASYGSDYQKFIIDQAATVGIVFTDDLLNGLIYVHGEGNAHKKDERVQRPLAAFMHHCDNTSARIWFDQSQCRGEW